MGNENKFGALTEVQELRDAAFIESVREEYVRPLFDEICDAVDGYADLDDWGKFIALMRLNEEHAPKGDYLMLDFGFCVNHGTARAAVYSGEAHLYSHSEPEGTCFYVPWFQDSMMGIGHEGVLNNVALILDREVGARETYEKLPLPFRVAVVALLLRQNVLVSYPNSCRFAAGDLAEIQPNRWAIQGAQSGEFQQYGWSIRIRDCMPENQLLIHLARLMRSNAKTNSAFYDQSEHPYLADRNPNTRPRRARNTSTELLVDFIDRVLPSQGLYVGRSGSGRRITWEQAYFMFDELHPHIYASKKSFADSYSNAKKKEREEGV